MDKNNKNTNNVDSIYQRLLPALNTKLAELKREKITSISTKDIWYYCIHNKWQNKKDLYLYELVSDILNIDTLKLQLYIEKENGRNL